MAGRTPPASDDSRPQEEPVPWTRAYPPLLVLVAAAVAAVLFLPSSLNLPQANPSTTLEYAPVPPDDSPAPAVNGNFSSLGVGGSRTIAGSRVQPPPPPPPPATGTAGRPTQKRCVGSPPRQTEDPASPPCVPFFEGDNFGATYSGVTRGEITVLVYLDVGTYGTSAGDVETTPMAGTYVDIDKPRLRRCSASDGFGTDPNQCDDINVRVLKGFSKYFNDRYQTYGRHVHYWAYFSNASTEQQRRADAHANFEQLRPFAVVDEARLSGFNEAYDSEMNSQGVLTFGSSFGDLPAAYYRENAPMSWGFFPDVEHWAALYSSYVCRRVAPYPVRRFGNPPGVGAPNGAKRRFGLWYTTDPSRPSMQLFAREVRRYLSECGANVVSESTYSHSGYAVDARDDGSDAAQAVARFERDGVTTVLYIGGLETRLSSVADSLKFYPEIVVAGDLIVDGNLAGQAQNQNVWQNAWSMSYQLRMNRLEDTPGYRAYKEGDPMGDAVAGFYARDNYADHFMLFGAIQVAGPRLEPHSVDLGFHAIPPRESTNPYSPALFFDPNDYTFVKDGAEEWWDPTGRPPGDPSSRPGCWRMTHDGSRHLAGRWPAGDEVFRAASDPCTGYAGVLTHRER